MMRKESSEIIQAFPVGPQTFVGTASNFNPKGYSILHCADDGNIDFHFPGGTTIALSVTTGMDIAIHEACESITSSGTVWIS